MNYYYYSRMQWICALFIMAYVLVIVNLFFIQIYRHHFFVSLGKQQYHTTLVAMPERAAIFDRNGIALATSIDSLSAFITPCTLTDFASVAQFLKTHFQGAYERLVADRNASFLYIKRRLTPAQKDLIIASNLADIKLLQESARWYPCHACASIVGITDVDNKGISGIEQKYNEQLSGSSTIYDIEKDARVQGLYFKKEIRTQGAPSTPVTLTIDSTLQFLVQELLEDTVKEHNAADAQAIIMDPFTGQILVMASAPGFNPNLPLQDKEIFLTQVPAITQRHEFGSVIKVFAALAALEEKVVTPDELIDCKGKKTAYFQGRKINTVAAHGTIPFAQVIAFSNNIGIAQIAHRLDTRLYDHYMRMGFGSKTGIELPGEQAGFVNPPDKWSKQSLISLSYGYEISPTLLSIACGFCLIANGGYKVQPTIVLDPPSLYSPTPHPLYSHTAIDQIKDMLVQTTEQGTARKAHIKGYKVMAKTGSANLLVNGMYDPNHTILTCAGIVQKDSYMRVVAVTVHDVPRSGVFAASVAAPLFEKIVKKMIIHEKAL